ncbi:hypothetical protein OAH46_01175 [Verrucomicrobia bacterium]|nr:hypothetical protein [Verrucomicrobiota bacterium]
MNDYLKILDPMVAMFIEPVRLINDNICSTEYAYLAEDDFKILLKTDWKLANEQYWKEILFKVHFASLASIIRNYSWLKGMATAYEDQNFLLYCSSFRSLIESAADSYDALNNVAMTLSENYHVINDALLRKSKNLSICKELEDQLIHFSHARRIGRKEAAPQSHRAKPATTYIKALDQSLSHNFYECYSELCQYTHPAAQSVSYMMRPINTSKFLFSPGREQQKIIEITKKYEKLIVPLLALSFNPAFLCLKVLKRLPIKNCHCHHIDQIGMSGIKAWSTICKNMNSHE